MAPRATRGASQSGGRNENRNTYSQSHNDATQIYQILVIRDITSILKTIYGGPWPIWKKVGKDDRDAMWQHFKVYHCMNRRFSDTMRKAREEAVIRAKAANVNVPPDEDLTFLKPYYPNWIREEYWVTLIYEVWNNPKWKRLSQSGKQNRSKLEDGSISKHTGGSISTR
ncbi:hypothetical protein L1887_00914 [Cichorium endivia]|nr:hypothetical protein L1887_00914 [Cichorium endivia]